MTEDIVRVLRLVEYIGPRSMVEKQVEASIHGERRTGWLLIRGTTLSGYPEKFEGSMPELDGMPYPGTGGPLPHVSEQR